MTAELGFNKRNQQKRIILLEHGSLEDKSDNPSRSRNENSGLTQKDISALNVIVFNVILLLDFLHDTNVTFPFIGSRRRQNGSFVFTSDKTERRLKRASYFDRYFLCRLC
jgi:hypothetical protein